MSKLSRVQLGSDLFQPVELFSTFQGLSSTTLTGFPASMGEPVQTEGNNPIGVIDNRQTRAVNLLLTVAGTAADAKTIQIEVTGFSKILGTDLWLPVKFFGGEAQTSTFDASALGETGAKLCDNFSTETFVGSNVALVEPADNTSAALMVVDIRGFELIAVRLGRGASAEATKAQVFYGVN